MRIWMNPDRMASLGITTSDIQQAVQAQNALFGAGQIGQQPTQTPVELSFPGRDAAAVHRSGAVREHDPARQQSRQRDRAAEGCRARRSRTQELHRRLQAQRRAGDLHRRLPAARRQRAAGVRRRARGARTDDSRRFRRASRRSSRSTRPTSCGCRSRRSIKTLFEAIVLVVLVVYLFLQSFRATFICIIAVFVALVGRVQRHVCARLLAEPADAVRADAGDRHGDRRCDRRRRERRPQHARARAVAEGRGDPLDGGSVRAGRRGRAGAVRGVRAGGLPAGHDRAALQAVRDHDRRVGDDLGLRRADADTGDVRADADEGGTEDHRASSAGSTASSRS